MSLIHLYYLNDKTKFNNVIKTNVHSSNPAIELAVDGLISLGLTLVNIICIYIAGIIVYVVRTISFIFFVACIFFLFFHSIQIKEVNSSDNIFWKLDLKAARDLNKTFTAESKIGSTEEQIIVKNIENSLPIFSEK